MRLGNFQVSKLDKELYINLSRLTFSKRYQNLIRFIDSIRIWNQLENILTV